MVVVTALPTIAVLAGANRVLRGVSITHPTGDPALPPAAELDLRRRLVERALALLEEDVAPGTVVDRDEE